MALTNLPNTNNHFSFLKSIFFGVICSSISISHGVEGPTKPNYHVVEVSSLIPKSYCTGHTKGSSLGSQKLAVTSRYGPCSRSPSTNQISSYNEALRNDAARVKYLNFKKDSEFYSNDAAESGSTLQVSKLFYGEYLTTIGLGTPKRDYDVLIDTGSDDTWVQCKPCSEGCKPEETLFDPSKSSTYSNGPCKFYTGNDPFNAEYLDNTSSSGHWGCDKLFLEPSDVFEKFQFGCGLVNRGNSDNFANGSGVLGLGRGDLSLVSQTASKFGKTFSYCLPMTSSSKGYIEFGDRARSKVASSGLKFTSLVPPTSVPSPYTKRSYYFLELLGISVAGIRLNVASTVFTSVGTVIDSGTVLTYLPARAYFALRTAFKESMAEYPPAAPQEYLDTCYNIKGNTNVSLPDIVFHFGGGTDVPLNPSGIVRIYQENILCLGFSASNRGDLTIIGNNQQREMDILYDIDAGRIGFGTKPCNG